MKRSTFLHLLATTLEKAPHLYENSSKKIREINIESLKFHFYRGDFENWIIGTLRDEKLGEEIKNLRSQRLSEHALRNQLYSIVLKRYTNLKQELSEKKLR